MAERDLVWDRGGEIPEEPLPDDDGNIEDQPGDVRHVYVPEFYTLTAPDGRELKFEIFGMFTDPERTRQYMVLHEAGTPADEAFLSPCGEGEGGLLEFRDFESEEEYEAAAARFEELFRGDVYGDSVYAPAAREEFFSVEDESAEAGSADDEGKESDEWEKNRHNPQED